MAYAGVIFNNLGSERHLSYLKDAMEGMLAPTVEEVITGNIEVREVFKISKVGTVAGCYVTDGQIARSSAGVRFT